MWSLAILAGLTGSAFASGKGGGHSGGGGSHHHHSGSIGGSSHHHHHGGYSGFSIGIGGLGYGYRYGGYPYGYGGYGYGGYPYGYGTGYYSSPNYYYSTPTYSYPRTVIINSRPAVPAPNFDNGPIVILAPAANEQPVDYTLNGQPFAMKPGQSQKFNHDRDWIVDFDRGAGKGAGKYSLKAGTYKFKMTDNGWELFEAAKPEPPTDMPPPPPVPAP
jgi:hypothetical protein